MHLLDTISDFLSGLFENNSCDHSTFLDSGGNHLCQHWDVLTEHQKSLCNAIENCGVHLDSSKQCLRKVMDAIDADPSDESFVQDRISLLVDNQAFISYVDKVISDAEKLVK